MNFAIAAGGTGGHLFPGLAVGEVLLSRGHQVMLIVSEKEIDAIATQGRSDFRIAKVAGVGLQGKSPLKLINFAAKFVLGLRQSRALFREFKPAAVLGMGGFTSLAPILAARKLRAPAFVHDSNAIPGKANKLNARFCRAVLLGFQEAAAHFRGAECIVTGTPVRTSLRTPVPRVEALRAFGLDADRATILAMGGSQGAHGLNAALAKALPLLKQSAVQFIHLTGKQDETMMRDAYTQAGIPAHVAPFFHQMEQAYSAANLAIARSGAASLTELSHFSLPAILIPYPFAADDHQTSNARIFQEAGAARLLPESEATGEALAQHLQGLLEAPAILGEMSARAGSIMPKDAAERVAEVILSHAKP